MIYKFLNAIRKNHAMEHATISLLLEEGKVKPPIAGYATPFGFFVLGKVDSNALDEAVNSAIIRLKDGEADLAVANTYYLALMLSGKKGAEQQAAAKKVKPFFPNQDGRGTHMNISGGGILKYAPNKANAIKLLEFLLTKDAQEHIVNNTFEYPMIDGVKPHKLVAQMGLGFKQDLKTKVSSYGKKQADALEVMLAAKWK